VCSAVISKILSVTQSKFQGLGSLPAVKVLPDPGVPWSSTTSPFPLRPTSSLALSGNLWPVTRPCRSRFCGPGRMRKSRACGFQFTADNASMKNLHHSFFSSEKP
jgi:hypothetical protein